MPVLPEKREAEGRREGRKTLGERAFGGVCPQVSLRSRPSWISFRTTPRRLAATTPIRSTSECSLSPRGECSVILPGNREGGGGTSDFGGHRVS